MGYSIGSSYVYVVGIYSYMFIRACSWLHGVCCDGVSLDAYVLFLDLSVKVIVSMLVISSRIYMSVSWIVD